jgi:hypothetical protein
MIETGSGSTLQGLGNRWATGYTVFGRDGTSKNRGPRGGAIKTVTTRDRFAYEGSSEAAGSAFGAGRRGDCVLALCHGTAANAAARRFSQPENILGQYRRIPARSPRARLCRRAEYRAGGALGRGRQSEAPSACSRARLTQTGCDRHEQRAGDTRREGGGRHHTDSHVDRRRCGGSRIRRAWHTPAAI